MSEHGTPDDLKSLGERLDRVRRDRMVPAAGDGKSDGGLQGSLGLGFRIGMELVVAVAVGLGIGWGIDRALGTRPWVMIAGLFLGFAAGLLNVWRAMKGMGMAVGYGRPAPPRKSGSGRGYDEDDEA